MSVERRDFLKGLAVGAGALVLGSDGAPLLRGADLPQRTKPKKTFSTDPCAMVPLTASLQCTRLGFGCGMRGWERASNLTRMPEEKAIELLQLAYAEGIRTIDMADLYGVHAIVTKALRDKPRDSYTLISKVWLHKNGLPETDRPPVDVSIKRFLKECKTNYLDLVQIHCMTNGNWTEEFAETMVIMERLKKEGLIRAHGVSCHANAALVAAAKTAWTDAVHVRINHEGVNMEGSVSDVQQITQACHDAGVGVIAMKVIGEGKFADSLDKRKKSVSYLTGLDCIDAMVVAFDEKEHITELLTNIREALEKIAAKEANAA